jgi:hypothetical protein
MDRTPPSSDVPNELMEQMYANYGLLCDEWDKMYPNNPIRGNHDDDES